MHKCPKISAFQGSLYFSDLGGLALAALHSELPLIITIIVFELVEHAIGRYEFKEQDSARTNRSC